MKTVLPSIARAVRTAANSMSPATPGSCAAPSTASRLASTVSVLGRPPTAGSAHLPTAGVPQRGIVTRATQQVIDQLPSTAAVAEHIKFQAFSLCELNMEELQHKVLAALSELSHDRIDNTLQVKTNPSADDVERAVQGHGPVRLKLQGMLPDEQGGSVYTHHHTTLVTAVLRDPISGLRVAVLADGNDLARNPLKAEAEARAKAQGKSLVELDEHDFQQIDAKIAQQRPGDSLKRSFFRLVDLDQTLAHHRTTQENLLVSADRLASSGTSSAVDKLLGRNSVPPITTSEIVFAKGTKVDGRMSEDTKAQLLKLVRGNPALVERPGDWGPELLQAAGQAAQAQPIPSTRDVLALNPALMAAFNAPSTAASWKPLASVDEVRAELAHEPTFATHLDTPEGREWCDKLFKKINAHSRTMSENDKGIELIARFKSTYGTNHHVAIGALWRDDSGKLRMGVVHQESVPVDKKNWQGHVYRTFDTANDYPGGIAPVAESMKLAGLPDIKVLSCSQPDKIVATGKAMEGAQNAAPYGPYQTWAAGDKGRFSADKNFMTCFNVTADVHDVINGTRPHYRPLLPELLRAIGPLTNTSPKTFETVKIRGEQYRLHEIKDLPFQVGAGIFLALGKAWGEDGEWDVTSPRATLPGRVKLLAGKDVALPEDALPAGATGAKILNPRGLATGEGKQVERERVYTREEIAAMRYSGEEPATINLVASVPKE